LKEDDEEITSNPEMAEKIPELICIAKQVTTGNRRRVLENGDDKERSEDEDIPDMKPDEEPNAYTPRMDQSKGPVYLSPSQVGAQLAASKAQKAQEAAQAQRPQESARTPPRSQSPANGSSDDDDLSQPEWKWSQTKGCMRRNKAWIKRIAESALALPAPEPQKALSAPSDLSVPSVPEPLPAQPAVVKAAPVGEKKAAASQKAPEVSSPAAPTRKALMTPEPIPEAKASKPKPKPTKGRESPEAKASHQMSTRQRASGAGGLRSGGGSGQTDTRVAQSNPSKT
jgi:hypothetical protein